MNKYFSQEFDHWLKQNALAMDQQTGYDAVVFNAMAKQSLFALGVPNKFQGRGDTKFQDAFYALIEVAKRSLNAAFILWAQRGVIHFLLQHKQHVGSQKLLPKLVKGELAAATALSNLIKHLGGVEELQTQAIPSTNGWKVNGLLPWVTNVQENRFMVVFAAQTGKDKAGVFFAFNTQPNLSRSEEHTS